MVEKRLRGALGVSLLSLIAGACTEAPSPGKNPDAGVVEKAPVALEGLQVIAVDEAAVPTFVTGPLGVVPTGGVEPRSGVLVAIP